MERTKKAQWHFWPANSEKGRWDVSCWINWLPLIYLCSPSFYSLSLFTSIFFSDVCRPGWSFFEGICYLTSRQCKNWTEAQKTCQSYSTNLVTVKNQEENVYIQHRLKSAKGWIGLSDRDSEGTFTWADNQPNNFTYWAKNQPNNFNDEDCVHTLGTKHGFTWNDVGCNTCHNFTCSEGMSPNNFGVLIMSVRINYQLSKMTSQNVSPKLRKACRRAC